MEIYLPSTFTELHKSIISRYLTHYRTLSSSEWLIALEGFDILGDANIVVEGYRITLKKIYNQFIDEKYVDGFLENLWESAQPEQDGMRLKSTIAGQIFKDLSNQGLYARRNTDSQFVLTYCSFWWDAFAKGYIFEAVIFQNLRVSGIDFAPHDFRNREQRFSRSDLYVSGFRGDIKTSTYFLHSPRTNILANDFYITRLFQPDERRWIFVVLMQDMVFRIINGEAVECELKTSHKILPTPVRIKLLQCDLVVLTYEMWKQKIKTLQERGRSNVR